MSQLATQRATDPKRLLLIGNPNVGKSLLFGCLTNRYVTVSNYPGTTVEITTAKATIAGEPRLVVDTPGTNGLIPQSDDERVARDMLLDSPDADVVQVGDMSNLRRTLLLSLQLAEHDVPFTLCLNMSDEARERDSEIDPSSLAVALGVPVVATSALRRWNLERLRREAIQPKRAKLEVSYPAAIEQGVVSIIDVGQASACPGASGQAEACPTFTRGFALSILAGDETLTPYLPTESLAAFDRIRHDVQRALAQPPSIVIANARLTAVDRIIGNASATQHATHNTLRDRIGVLTMHPVWGVPFLAAVLYIAWLFVGKLGAGTLVDFVETKIFEEHINVWATAAADAIIPWKFLHDLLVGPYGVITMALTYAIAIVLPVVITFFFFFGVLEDSGYLPRLAV
ncbi:MAG TPA: FeoB small GTPase domain-containing protein, partial [Thermoanaerobaculia bacterium]|nr:FeoB small GTPase domain-containing protein [Thermoanaerobaculia bacterium]